ncbi:hypothetical protein FRC03_003856 [Tulasnella sp. 419]|nr:hypothetical protein FRC03_003856 [Tulasnella sp. 419]
MNPASLHIFYDQRGNLLAFNKDGGLFVNLRWYEEWHDLDVKNGKTDKSLIFWYHTIAHEIAHNVFPTHNTEHEFLFAAICGNHLMDLAKLLNIDRDQQEAL